MIEGIPPLSLVLLNLGNPKEKLWGVLHSLSAIGVTIRGINVETFEDWARQVSRGGELTLDLVTMFVPLARVERMFVDEPVGSVPSYSQRFEQIVGVHPEIFLGLKRADA